MLGFGKGDRDAGRGGVPVAVDAVHHPVSAEPEALGYGGQDAAVGLVEHEQVDVVEGQPRTAGDLERDLAHRGHGGPERRSPLHPQLALDVRGADQGCTRRVGAKLDRPDRAGPRRRHDRRARPVAEQPGGRAVVVVGHVAEQVGADDQHALGPPGLDLTRGQRQPREEPGARRADVDRPRPPSADRACHERSRMRQKVVGGEGGDKHQVDVAGLDPGAFQGGAARPGGQIDEAFVGRRDVAGCDTGA